MTQPRSKLPILVVAIGIVLAGGLLWWIGGAGDTRGGEAGLAGPDVESTGTAPASATPAQLAATPTSDSEPALAESDAEPAARESVDPTAVDSWDDGSAGAIRGRVILPPAAPRDDTLEVFALTRSASLGNLYDEDGLFAAPLGQVQDSSSNRVLSRAKVESDGTFELRFPGDKNVVPIALRGRFVYLDGGTVEARPEDGEVTLEPQLGGVISGRIQLASGAASQLEGTLVRLAPDELATLLGSGRGIAELQSPLDFIFERFTRVDADGAFFFGGVPASEGLKVIARPEHYAHAEREDLVVEAARATDVRLTVSAGAALVGHVLDERGDPIADAEVRAHRTIKTFGMRVPGDKLRTAQSDANGGFELVGVMPGSVRLVAEHADYLANLGDDLEVVEGERREVVVELKDGASIAGDVYLPDGRPAAEAHVQVERKITDVMTAGMGIAIGREGEARTDADGHFAIDALAEASFKVRASWEDPDGEAVYARVLDDVRSGEGPLRIDLDAPILVVGRVVNEDGEPIPEFQLKATTRSDMPWLPNNEREREDFESEDGSFAWGDLHEGTWDLTADAEGYATSESVELHLPATDAESELVLVLPRTARVAGRVTTPDGAPAAGAEVSLNLDAMATLMGAIGLREVPTATADDEGRFTIEIPPGDQALGAQHSDWADAEPVPFSIASSEELTGVELRLRRGALLTGEVYGKEGELAAGVQIILQRPTGTGQRFAQSDRDGFFTFERVTPGDWQLVAMVGDRMVFGDEGFDMGQMMENMHIAMVSLEDEGERHILLGAPPEDPVRVIGQVKHAGEPLGDVMISFFSAEGRASSMEGLRMTQADDEGRFELQLDEPGAYILSAQRLVDFTGQQQSVEFREDIPAAEEHRLVVEMPGGSIRGRVLSADGEPAADERVSLTSSDGFAYGSLFGGQYAEVRTDEKGRYELLYLREGTYSVGAGGAFLGGAFGDNSSGGRVVVSGIRVSDGKVVDGVDFELSAPGKVQGVVRDTTGKPVAETAIFLRDDEGALLELFSMVMTDAGGKFQYTGVAPGEYTVTAQSRSVASTSPASVRVRSSETSKVELVVDDGTTLLVSLEDKTGADVEANVRVTGPDGREWTGMMSMSRLMELMGSGFDSAEQKVGPLPAGTYEVRAIAADGREAKKKITLRPGQPERKVRLRLRD